MKKNCIIYSLVIFSILALFDVALAQETLFQYPYYLLDVYNPDDDCWYGMDIDGYWPVPVDPEQLLIGPPPSEVSGVTIPSDHWLEFKYQGRLIDGPGNDIFLIENDAVNEQALVFITDGSDREYLLGYAFVRDIGIYEQTEIGFDITGISFPFEPSSIRVVGLDYRGGSPGFDLANIRARINPDCGHIACNPNPPDGVKNVPIDTVLKWSPESSAHKHIVYFGPSLTDVDENATPVNYPTQPQDANSFTPPALDLGKTYYWRIDQINDNDPNSPLMGDIWKFTTIDHLVIDNFESYETSTLDDTWTQINQANIYLSKKPDPVKRCRQAMALHYYYYYETVFDSGVTTTFTPAQDWTHVGIKTLELFFYGQTDNETGVQMYITLSDGDVNAVVPYNGDANDLKNETWQPWRIDLQNLGLNLSNIENISIGFRRSSSESWDSGTVFFDDIKLYPSRCLEENKPDADFNSDCIVDFQDLQELTNNWLEKGHNTYPVEAPDAPIAWYKFDGNADDSAGSAHGKTLGHTTYVEGVHGQAISFGGYIDSVEITDAAGLFSKTRTAITIAFWQYGTDSIHHTDTLCCYDYEYNVYDPTIAINLGCWKSPGKYNWDCGSPWSFDSRLSGKHKYKTEWSQRWNHWAFTKETKTGQMQIFLNGVLYDSRIGANSPILGITSFEIGSGWYGGYDGLIDDFQIYDYALSQSEIAYAATNGTGIFDLPLISPVDLNDDNIIDFKDFAILADNWLDKNLWP
ncbi:MAG: LamG domain-containing protein [Planctomycetota bacterium]